MSARARQPQGPQNAGLDPRSFETLADLYPEDAVFAVDAQRSIVFWSKGAEKVLGFRAEEVLGQHCLKANRCGSCMRGCGIAEHGRVREVPLVMFRPDGSSIRVKKTAQAFFDETGVFQGGVEVLRPETGPKGDDERARIEWALAREPRNMEAAAALLGMSRATFWRKRKKLGLT
ncbi:MAG: PAS domain-containing protein [Myxococcota bacterium]